MATNRSQSVDGGGPYTAHVTPAAASRARWSPKSPSGGGGPAHVAPESSSRGPSQEKESFHFAGKVVAMAVGGQ